MNAAPCSALILTAGRTERMRSARPQPLHMLCGRPMVQYVIDALGPDIERIVMVLGDSVEQVSKKLAESVADPRLVFAEARAPRGSAEHAMAGLEVFADDFGEDDLLIVSGNTPLLTRETVDTFVDVHQRSGSAATVLAVPAASTEAFGHVVEGREAGRVQRILPPGEAADAPVPYASAGIFCVRRSLLAPAIRRVRPNASTGSFELADVVEVLADAGHIIGLVALEHDEDVRPVEDRVQLAAAEATIRRRTNLAWMQRGVTMIDPDRTYIDTTVRLSPDVTLFPGTMLQGSTVVGSGTEIGPDTRLADCAVGADATVEKTMGREAEVGQGAHVGPFAVLDIGSAVAPGTATGPFFHGRADD